MKTPRTAKSLSILLAGCLAALSLASTIITLVILQTSATATLRDQIGQNLAELAYQTTDKLDHGLFERYREVELLARRKFLSETDASPAGAEERLNEIQRTYPAYSWIGVADLQGRVVASTNGLIRGADVSKRPWWSNAQHGLHLGDLHDAKLLAYALPKVDGEPQRFIDVAFPFNDATGKMAGVVGVHMSWQWTQEIERSVIMPAQKRARVDALIVSTDNTVLLGPKSYQGKKLSVPSLEAARAAANHFLIEKWDDGKEYLVGYSQSRPYQSSPGLGWTVLVRQNTQEAFAPVRRLQAQVFYGGLATSLVFTLFAFFAASRIARPMRLLARDAKAIQEGTQDRLTAPPMAYREVADLGNAFVDLIDNLHQHVAERSADAIQSANRVRLIADNLPIMIACVDRDERYTFCNRIYLQGYGLTQQRMLGATVASILGERMYRNAKPNIDRVMRGERVVFVNTREKDGQKIWLQTTYIPDTQADGSVIGFYAMTQDITDSTNVKLSLEHDALHDSLTGLPNRASCMEHLKGAIARAQRSSVAMAVMFLDIDKFKAINDTHGHAAGDAVLIAFAERLKRCMRDTDYVCRLAGDEFVVVAESLAGGEHDAILVAEKILAELGAPSALVGMENGISCSIGISHYVVGATSPEALLQHADGAMYEAKRGGLGRIRCFDATKAMAVEVH